MMCVGKTYQLLRNKRRESKNILDPCVEVTRIVSDDVFIARVKYDCTGYDADIETVFQVPARNSGYRWKLVSQDNIWLSLEERFKNAGL